MRSLRDWARVGGSGAQGPVQINVIVIVDCFESADGNNR